MKRKTETQTQDLRLKQLERMAEDPVQCLKPLRFREVVNTRESRITVTSTEPKGLQRDVKVEVLEASGGKTVLYFGMIQAASLCAMLDRATGNTEALDPENERG